METKDHPDLTVSNIIERCIGLKWVDVVLISALKR